jgi:hypothetical protein
MRLATRLLVLVTAVALFSCGGGDDAAAPPLAQRFVTAADAPGTKPDPEEERQTSADLDEFMSSSQPFIDPDTDEMTTIFEDAGFEGAGTEARFFGETHEPHAPHVFSSFYELESEDGARSVLDWLETDSMKPCPHSCAVRVSTFDVDGIPDARGVHRIATAESIEAAGFEDQQPSDEYLVAFTVGSFVYTMALQGPPGGSVSEEQALEIASAYHDRLAGN